MSTGTTTHESATSLREATWQQYVELRDSDEYRNTRMTFDRGRLELMSPSKLHERVGYLMGRCIDVWTEERQIEVQSCRSTTFRRQDLPGFPCERLTELIKRRTRSGETTLMREFRAACQAIRP